MNLHIKKAVSFTFFFFVGCALTMWFNRSLGLNVVLSSALAGAIGSFLPKRLEEESPALVYAGSFAGMSSASVLESVWQVVIVSVIGGVLYQILSRRFLGVGGKLGFCAFLSVALFRIIGGRL